MKKQVLSLGVGWFALQAIWTTYNAFMPLFYKDLTSVLDPATGKLIPNLFLVGLLMATDNITGLLAPALLGRAQRPDAQPLWAAAAVHSGWNAAGAVVRWPRLADRRRAVC